MQERFKNLTKLSSEPAAKILAAQNARLETQLAAPASAPIDEVLSELAEKDAPVDMLRLLSAVLPPRERVWWACLAARDIIGSGPENATPSLKAAEDWVFKPTEENRAAAVASLDYAPVEDDTVHCALSVMYADGTLGPGELAQHPGPPGGSSVTAFAMNIEALGRKMELFDDYVEVLIDRALDIARGGSGKIDVPVMEEAEE
ncbi:MAG: hypothetical protein HKN30_10175 [Sulfitobacter sp.]|nr:hypothetical protein [Sulfitobacter sp.]